MAASTTQQQQPRPPSPPAWRSPACMAVVLLLLLVTFSSPLLLFWQQPRISIKDLKWRVIKPVFDHRWRLIEQKKMSMKRYQLPAGLAAALAAAHSFDPSAAGGSQQIGPAANDSDGYSRNKQPLQEPQPQQIAADSSSGSSSSSHSNNDGAVQQPSSSRHPVLPVYVVSIPRLTERHAYIARCMAAQNVSYEMVWGMDGKQQQNGQQQIPDSWVDKYAGDKYRQWLAANSTHETLMFASLMSHVQGYHRMLSHRDPLAVFLEDDACIADFSNWSSRLLTALRNLPDDWDILYLWGFGGELGQLMGPGVRTVHKIASVACYVVRDSGAHKLIRLLESGDQHIDKALFHLEWKSAVQAYITEPPLCSVSGTLPSTLEYPSSSSGLRNITASRRSLLWRRLLSANGDAGAEAVKRPSKKQKLSAAASAAADSDGDGASPAATGKGYGVVREDGLTYKLRRQQRQAPERAAKAQVEAAVAAGTAANGDAAAPAEANAAPSDAPAGADAKLTDRKKDKKKNKRGRESAAADEAAAERERAVLPAPKAGNADDAARIRAVMGFTSPAATAAASRRLKE